MNKIFIKVKAKDPKYLPTYATEHSAGADVRAAIDGPLFLKPTLSILVPTGIYVEIPEGYEIQIRPRSGLALNHQITVLNTPGTIDSDYRGEIKVILINHGKQDFMIMPEMRIAQLIVAPVVQAEFILEQELATTQRAHSGFGSSGVL